MNKESIQTKIAQARANVDESLRSGNVSAEAKVLIDSLLVIIEILAAVFLEKKTRKNSGNSGMPPSRDNGSNGNRNKDSGNRPPSGQQADNVKHIETRKTVTPKNCQKCGANLHHATVKGCEQRQKIDIMYEIVTHTVTSEIKDCPRCGQVNKGKFSEGMDGKLQYGDSIKAAIINFIVVQMMSLQRVQEHMMGLVGRMISQAVMLKYLTQLSDQLEVWEAKKIEELLKVPSLHCDETSIRVNKKAWWLHTYGSGDITLQFLHHKRGREAMDEIGIIPRYGGILIHDFLSSYLSYQNAHAFCGPHLLRELKFIEQAHKYAWATGMKKLLMKAAEVVGSRPQKRRLSNKEYQRLMTSYREILTQGLDEMPLFPGRSGKQGRAKQSEAQNLWQRLMEYEDSVLLFARCKDVDFSNNRAERDLRMSKVKMKVAGCFRTSEMAKAFYRVSSYLKTMKYKGYSANEAITLALKGEIPA